MHSTLLDMRLQMRHLQEKMNCLICSVEEKDMCLGLGVVSGLGKEMGCSNGLHNVGLDKGKAKAGQPSPCGSLEELVKL